MAKSKAERNLEYYKGRYLEALKSFESEEELRLAALHEPKVNLNNVFQWSAYLQGARAAVLAIMENSKPKQGDNAIYAQAVFKLITSELRYMGMFLTQSHDICYRNHVRDKKGKLISCEAYFAEKVVIYKEV